MDSHYLRYLADSDDPQAVLSALMDQYGDDVWRFTYFLTRRADVADDLSQEVFLAAYEHLYRFRGEGSVKSWLLTIARNKAAKYRRSSYLRKVTLVDQVRHHDPSRSAEAEWFDTRGTREIWVRVMQLPSKLREVLLLSVHYELSMQEMAVMLGVSIGTVKSRLHRARKKVSELLKEAGL